MAIRLSSRCPTVRFGKVHKPQRGPSSRWPVLIRCVDKFLQAFEFLRLGKPTSVRSVEALWRARSRFWKWPNTQADDEVIATVREFATGLYIDVGLTSHFGSSPR